MLPNAFIGKADKPSEHELAAELGPSKTLWDRLLAELAEEYDISVHEWHSYSRKAGWSLKLKQRERTILYFGPCQGCFRVAFVLGDKALQAARQTRLPQRITKLIDGAKRYPEGTAIRLEPVRQTDLPIIKKLAKAKLDN